MRFTLTTKTLFFLTGIIIVGMAGSIASLGYAWQMRRTMESSISKNAMEMLSAAEVDIALLKQQHEIFFHVFGKGSKKEILSPGELDTIFRETLLLFKNNVSSPDEINLLRKLSVEFNQYDALLRNIISLIAKGDETTAQNLYLNKLDPLYHQSARTCDQLVAWNKRDIIHALEDGEKEFQHFHRVIIVSILLIGLLGSGLIWLLFYRVFRPIKQMARAMEGVPLNREQLNDSKYEDDLELLVGGLKLFVSEVAESRSDLANIQSELTHSKRLAAVGNTVTQVAHEIKNRLVSLGGFALSIEKRPEDPEKVRQKAQVIIQDVQKLERLLQQITEFSKPIWLDMQRCSVNVFLKEILPAIEMSNPKNIEIKTALHWEPLLVLMDAERMEQVVVNLVRNAAEAMEAKGSGWIKLSVLPRGEHIAVLVEDNGPGIPATVLDHIFEPFFTTKKKGTGLGLAISRKIILEHGGDLTCSSSADQGTTFTIMLPILRDHADAKPSAFT